MYQLQDSANHSLEHSDGQFMAWRCCSIYAKKLSSGVSSLLADASEAVGPLPKNSSNLLANSLS